MNLTPIFDDFTKQLNGERWGQNKIFGGKNQEPWISE